MGGQDLVDGGAWGFPHKSLGIRKISISESQASPSPRVFTLMDLSKVAGDQQEIASRAATDAGSSETPSRTPARKVVHNASNRLSRNSGHR
jgi:hypothetical protein